MEELLGQNENISARAVARLHPTIRHASSITRNEARSGLLREYQEKQKDIRKHLRRISKGSKENIAKQLAKKDQKIAELQRQVKILTASHVAMIRAVGELGGMSKWLQFYEDYKQVRDELQKIGAMPDKDSDIMSHNASDKIIYTSR